MEAGEQSMGSQLTVLSETEAAALVAKQPYAASSTNVGSPASSLLLANSSPLQLQQPPFKLKAASRGLQLSAVFVRDALNAEPAA